MNSVRFNKLRKLNWHTRYYVNSTAKSASPYGWRNGSSALL